MTAVTRPAPKPSHRNENDDDSDVVVVEQSPETKVKRSLGFGKVAGRVSTKVTDYARSRRLERQGFLPLAPGRLKVRHRILPRTVIGISLMLLCIGLGAAFSGAGFYAYYDNRLAENEEEVARFVDGFDRQFTEASGALDELRSESITQIRRELVPLGEFVTDQNGVVSLPQTVGESVYLLSTASEDGQKVLGAAFAVAELDGGTALLTSYTNVAASVTTPSPDIVLTKGDTEITANLWAWDADYDIALITVSEIIPTLSLADPSTQLATVGGRVFALSGYGGQGATASPGVLLDLSAQGLQHTAAMGPLFVGGPLLNSQGVVVGVASENYNPLNIDTGDIRHAPDVQAICERILSCADALAEEPAAPTPTDITEDDDVLLDESAPTELDE